MKGAAWTEAFLEMMAVERSAARNTLTAYGKDLGDASGFLVGRGRDLSDAAAEDVEAYFADLGARGMAPATAARRRAAVRQFYRFVLGEGWRRDDPSRRVEAPRQGRPLPKVLTREEVERLIAAAAARDGGQGLRLACMVELIYASGLRVSELLALPLAALSRDPAYLMVTGKGGKERLAPLNDAARGAVKAYLEVRPAFLPKGDKANPWLFASRGKGGRLSTPPLRPAPRRNGGRRGDRPCAGQPSRAAARLRHPPAGRRRGSAGDPDAARARRHRHHPDLHARGRGPVARRGGNQAPAGA